MVSTECGRGVLLVSTRIERSDATRIILVERYSKRSLLHGSGCCRESTYCVFAHAHESKRSGEEEDDRPYSASANDQILVQGERVSY
jgi:hypothetical protein